jgi:hypothetical protein
MKRGMTKETEVEDEVEAVGMAKDEEKVMDKLKMKKEVPTTLHVVEDAVMEEVAE